jgi:hypothetical protein
MFLGSRLELGEDDEESGQELDPSPGELAKAKAEQGAWLFGTMAISKSLDSSEKPREGREGAC